jgi:hypothetical protein
MSDFTSANAVVPINKYAKMNNSTATIPIVYTKCCNIY